MLLDCPACARSYHVNPTELDGGRTVICPRCHVEWFVEADGQAAPPETVSRAMLSDTPQVSRRVPSGNLRMAGGVCAFLALVMGIIGARTSVVRLLPRTEALFAAAGMPVNIRGLAFSKISFADAADQPGTARADMAVTGEIRNVAARRMRMPRLAFEIRDAAGEALLSWTEKAPAPSLAVGDVLAFKSTPHAMPERARSLLVRFETDDQRAGGTS